MLDQCYAYQPKEGSSFSLNSILIDKNSFIEALDNRFLSDLSNNFSTLRLCKHYYLNELQLNQLLVFANQKLNQGNVSAPVLRSELVRTFEQKYLVLNRYCRLRGLKCREISEKLTAHGHSPAFAAYNTSLCLAYPKSETLTHSLQTIRKELS